MKTHNSDGGWAAGNPGIIPARLEHGHIPLDIAAAECGIPLLVVWELVTDGVLPAVRTELSPGVFQWRCADLAAWRAYAGSHRQAVP